MDPSINDRAISEGRGSMKLVIVGATGRIGSMLVSYLKGQGHHVVAASPSLGVNTITGDGLAEAVEDATVVVDVTNAPSYGHTEAREFFETSTRNLQLAEVAAGVAHHVVLSVVGTDRLSESGYFRAKLAQETIVRASPIPYTILRATQFFEFVESIADAATEGTIVRVPVALLQPMALADAVKAVVGVALGAPQNDIRESGGPERLHLDDLIRRVLTARHDRRGVVSDRDARYFGARLHERALLPGYDAKVGKIRLDDWLHGSSGGNVATASRVGSV